MYTAYCIHSCIGNQDQALFLARRLFQQYIVDAWASTEQNRLNWVHNNQSTICSELYKGMADALYNGDADMAQTGKVTVLPSSHSGSPCAMHQLYQDSMAIC